jgi:hypothetical protein
MSDENKGFLPIIIMAIMAIIVGAAFIYIGFFTTISLSGAMDPTLTPTAAIGTLTLTGNASCGERINITTTSGQLINMVFNVTDGCAQVPTGNVNVSVINGGNGSINAAAAIVSTLNKNASFVSEMVATNATSQTVITYLTTGIIGNNVITTETMTNGSFTRATLSGGVDGSESWESNKSSTNTAFTLGGVLIMLLGVAGLITCLLKGFAIGGSLGRN